VIGPPLPARKQVTPTRVKNDASRSPSSKNLQVVGKRVKSHFSRIARVCVREMIIIVAEGYYTSIGHIEDSQLRRTYCERRSRSHPRSPLSAIEAP